jgi:rod shape-determining protein MreD
VIPGVGAVLRLGLLVLAAVVLQISGFAEIEVLGGTFDLMPLVVAAVALYGGAVPGAVCGFAAGLLLDLEVGQDLGASSLVLTGVGYWVGRFREVRDPGHALTPIPVAAVATLGYGAGIAVVSFMLSIDSEVSELIFRTMLVNALLNALIALPVFALVRRFLRPVLAVDPFEPRRRRAPTTTRPIGLRGIEG